MNKSDLQKLLGQRIIKLRQQRNLSQRQLAFLCNKDPQSIERVENGKSCPTAFYIFEICLGLEISLGDFFKDM